MLGRTGPAKALVSGAQLGVGDGAEVRKEGRREGRKEQSEPEPLEGDLDVD